MNIIITGASKGLGKAIAEKFAANNWNVYMCARNEHALFSARDELSESFPGIKVAAKAFDLSVKEEAQALENGFWNLIFPLMCLLITQVLLSRAVCTMKLIKF